MVGLELGVDSLQRAGHSAVLWDGLMWVYGGYTFPVGSKEMKLESSLWRLELHMPAYHRCTVCIVCIILSKLDCTLYVHIKSCMQT